MFYAEGSQGAITVGTSIGFRLGKWKLDQRPETLGGKSAVITAKVVSSDPFWSLQTPQVLWLDFGYEWWVFVNAETVEQGHYRVHGDPEVRESPWVDADLKRQILSGWL